MSSLLRGLKFVESDETKPLKHKKKHTIKNKKERTKRSKLHKKRSELVNTSSKEEDDGKLIETKVTTTLPRDDWMSMPYMRPKTEGIEQQKTSTELQAEAKQKKIQEEINAGMREPVTGMVYGLYDPKKPDAAPTVSSKIVHEQGSEDLRIEDDVLPRFGDGGASWRAKMLKRAEKRARASGVALEEVVRERFGSIAALQKSVHESARENAHLQYKRHRMDDKSERERQTLEIQRDATDKTLLAKYSTRVQRSVMHVEKSRHKEGSRWKEGRNLTRRTDPNDEDEEPIDYDKLPDFEGRSAETGTLGRENKKSQDRRTREHKRKSSLRLKHGRSQSRSRERSVDAKRPRRSDCFRSRSRSRHRSRSPGNNDKLCQDQQKRSKAGNKTALLVKPKETPYLRVREDSKLAAEKVKLEKRNAFLYGNTKPADCTVTKQSDITLPGRSQQNQVFEAKISGSFPSRTMSSVSVESCGGVEADEKNEKGELNKLAAKALRAQMMGKTALFHKLTEQLNELEATLEREKMAAAVPHYEALPSALPPLEKEDMRYGSRRGKKKHANALDVNGPELEASLEELVREERLSSTRIGQGNMDATHARNILRLGSRYKGNEVNAPKFSSGFDEEEQVDMNLLQEPGLNLTRRARGQREHALAVNETKHWDERTLKCSQCTKSSTFKKHLILSLGEFTYLAVPNHPRLHAKHCVIVPIDHTCSVVQADEQVREEIKRFQTALTSMCDQEYGMSMVFIEQTNAPHRKRHTWIDCIPVDSELALDMPLYFKQELMQADNEWSTHQAIIDTSKGDIRNHVPPTFSYFHIQWHTRKGRGGYAHVIEDENKFPRDFGVNVVAGLLDVTTAQYRRRTSSLEDDKRDVLAFLETWKAFDWTQALDGGNLATP